MALILAMQDTEIDAIFFLFPDLSHFGYFFIDGFNSLVLEMEDVLVKLIEIYAPSPEGVAICFIHSLYKVYD